MPSLASVSLSDLEDACRWASAGMDSDAAAYISKLDGSIILIPSDVGLDAAHPLDFDDPEKYWHVPSTHELDLGAVLVRQFMQEQLPSDLALVNEYFRHRGAYAKFKALLHKRGCLDNWHEYERRATQEALVAWGQQNEINVVR